MTSISFYSAAESIDLDEVTMSIIDNELESDYVISLPERMIDWDKMLESNGITQQEYEGRHEVFIEYQSEVKFDEPSFFEDELDALNSTEVIEEEN